MRTALVVLGAAAAVAAGEDAKPRSKPCDVFTTIDGRRLCGPSLILPGWGKCGTNALARYLSQHPLVKWPATSEIEFDPRKIDPLTLVTRHNPGVWADDDYVWAIKYNYEGTDPADLGKALQNAYPSARVVITLCDPALLPFRWFRHHLVRTLEQRVPHQRASLTELQEFVSARFNLTSLLMLYTLRYNLPATDGCRHSAESRDLLSVVDASFSTQDFSFKPGGAFSAADGLCGNLYHLGETSTFVQKWRDAGYVLNATLSVVVMEEWSALGHVFIRTLLRMLQLDEESFRWDLVAGFRPVYAITGGGTTELESTGLADTHAVKVPNVALAAMASQCDALEGMLGYRPPWRACLHLPFPSQPPAPPAPPAPACVYGKSKILHGRWCSSSFSQADCESLYVDDLSNNPQPCRWHNGGCSIGQCDPNAKLPPSPSVPPLPRPPSPQPPSSPPKLPPSPPVPPLPRPPSPPPPTFPRPPSSPPRRSPPAGLPPTSPPVAPSTQLGMLALAGLLLASAQFAGVLLFGRAYTCIRNWRLRRTWQRKGERLATADEPLGDDASAATSRTHGGATGAIAILVGVAVSKTLLTKTVFIHVPTPLTFSVRTEVSNPRPLHTASLKGRTFGSHVCRSSRALQRSRG